MDEGRALSDQPEVLTVEEAAAMLRISKMTVYRLVARGDLPKLKLGGSVRIPRRALEAMMKP